MHTVVRILKDQYGEKRKENVWHYVNVVTGDNCTLCCGEMYEDCAEAVFEEKIVGKGGITCKDCISIIKHFKSIKL